VPNRSRPERPIGIEALLDAADAAEAGRAAGADDSATPRLPVSTSSRAFAEVFAQVTRDLNGTEEPPPAPEPDPIVVGPAPLRSPGDLVLVIGLAPDASAVAWSMATDRGFAEVRSAGVAVPAAEPRVDDRRAAMQARADGVRRGRCMLVAFGLDRGGRGIARHAETLRALSPDQVWVAVDAGRKPDDTARWVREVRAILPVDAVAVQGNADTDTPETIGSLGLPVGWVDGRPLG
jgi:hypothetical protein